ncbi:arginine deiminase family protein [Gemmatimonadota bacterium]
MAFLRKALVVEDEIEFWRVYFEQVFPKDDWQLEFAANSEEGISILKGDPSYDIILVDYFLNQSTGHDFLEQKIYIDDIIPTFLISGYPDKSYTAADISKYNTIPYFIDKDELITNPSNVSHTIRSHYEEYIAKLCMPSIYSESGRLRAVITHKPSIEVEHIDPDNLNWYLFESRPELKMMETQHDAFIRSLRKSTRGTITLDLSHLLYDIIKHSNSDDKYDIVLNTLFNAEIRSLMQVFSAHGMVMSELINSMVAQLLTKDPTLITEIILSGINIADIMGEDRKESMYTRKECQIIPPVPNMYFTRDPGFVLGDHIILSRMFWPIRRREPYVLREVIKHHPFFKRTRNNMIDLLDEPGVFSHEGGDVMAIAPGEYAIAISERTSPAAAQKIAHLLIKAGATRVFQPMIPAKRAFIHLDTVCSLIGDNHVLIHPDALEAYPNTLCWDRATILETDKEPESKGRFVDVLIEEFGKEPIETAGGGARARLEQFDDATNVFMADKNVAVAYNRNLTTNGIIKETTGITVNEFSGSDLVMGRGGPRCMTLPLNRDS